MSQADPKAEPKAEATTDQLLDHNYDGIQEFDNPLPGWWVVGFWLCILFAFPYVLWYHVGQGALREEVLKTSTAEIARLQAEAALKNPATNETLAVLLKDPTAMASAEALFAEKCVVCHAAQGQGLVGPNLTDEYWILGGELIEIHNTISKGGRPKKGMEAWGKKLKPQQVRQLAAFVSTLRTKYPNPPNPKKPEGEKTKP